MVDAIANVVKETTSLAGTGTPITLTGAVAGSQSFASATPALNGLSVPYRIFDPITGEWEINKGIFTSPSTLARNATPIESTNAGAKVDFAGNPETQVFIDVPASWYYLPGNFNEEFVLFAGPGGHITQGLLRWDDTTTTMRVLGGTEPAIQIDEAGAGTHYMELVNISTVASVVQHVSVTGNASLGLDAVADDLTGNQIITFHAGALNSTGVTSVEFHTKNAATKNAVIGCDSATHTYFCGDFGSFGIGINTTPDSKLHVHSATAGAVTAPSGTIATFEHNAPGYVTVLVPNANQGGLIVGSPADNDRGMFFYSCSTPCWVMRAEGTDVLSGFTTGVIIGTGPSTPDSKLHVFLASAGTVAAPTDTVVTVENSGNAYQSFLCGAGSSAGFFVGSSTDNDRSSLIYSHSSSTWIITVNTVVLVNISTVGIGVGLGGSTPAARFHGKVGSTDAIPCIELEQDDADEPFIEFDGASAASIANPVSSWKSGGVLDGFVRVSINGSDFWMPYFTAPSAATPNYVEVAITAAVTLTSTAFGKMHVISGTAANYSITLPAVSGNAGQMIHFRVAPIASATRLYTLDANASETIDGLTTRVLWANETVTLYCNGTEWNKIAGVSIPMACIMRRTTTQSITNATWTQISTNVVEVDNTSGLAVPLGNTTNGRAQVLRPGHYFAAGFASINLITAGSEVNGGVSKNSASPADNPNAFTTVSVPASTFAHAVGSGYFSCAAGDWLGAIVYHNHGSARDTRAVSTVYPSLSVIEIPRW